MAIEARKEISKNLFLFLGIVFVFFDLRKCDFDTYKGFCEKNGKFARFLENRIICHICTIGSSR